MTTALRDAISRCLDQREAKKPKDLGARLKANLSLTGCVTAAISRDTYQNGNREEPKQKTVFRKIR